MFTAVGVLMLELLPSVGMSQVPGGPGGSGPGGSGGSPDGNPVVPFDNKMTAVFLFVAVAFAVFTIKKLQAKKLKTEA